MELVATSTAAISAKTAVSFRGRAIPPGVEVTGVRGYNPKVWDSPPRPGTAARALSGGTGRARSGMNAAVPGGHRLLETTKPHRSPGRWEAALLVSGVVVLGLALALPWWSETATYGPLTDAQTFSPWNGVTVACAPSCGGLSDPPEPNPGVNSFDSLGLVDTALLYDVCLGLLLAAMVAAALSTVQLKAHGGGRGSVTRRPLDRVPGLLSVVTSAVGAGILPLLQPVTLRQDLVDRFFGASQWTASPSPESSFWGACAPGPYSGLCASGGSATWGPGLGWMLMVVGVALLLAALTQRGRRGSRARPTDLGASS